MGLWSASSQVILRIISSSTQVFLQILSASSQVILLYDVTTRFWYTFGQISTFLRCFEWYTSKNGHKHPKTQKYFQKRAVPPPHTNPTPSDFCPITVTDSGTDFGRFWDRFWPKTSSGKSLVKNNFLKKGYDPTEIKKMFNYWDEHFFNFFVGSCPFFKKLFLTN